MVWMRRSLGALFANMNTCRIEVHATTDAISVAERIGRIRPVKRNGYDGEVSESVKLPTNQRL